MEILGAAAAVALMVFAMIPTKLYEPTQVLSDGTVSADGTSPAPPLGLAAGAGLSKDAYALARMVISEAGGQPEIAQTAVAWATVNRARARRISIGGLLTLAKFAGNGFFGHQDQGRYAATSRDSTPAARTLAVSVIRGSVADPTGGAQQWDSPRAYKDWTGSSSAKADSVQAAREADGNALVTLPGIDPTVIRFWRPTRVAA